MEIYIQSFSLIHMTDGQIRDPDNTAKDWFIGQKPTHSTLYTLHSKNFIIKQAFWPLYFQLLAK